MAEADHSAQAFEQLAAPHERQIYFVCLRMMGDPQDAQDCAQETFLKAYRAWAGFRGEAAVSTWLYRIAMRCCTDQLRKRHDEVSFDQLREEGYEPPSDEPSPYLQLEALERKRLLEDALRKLPLEQRQVLVLCDLQGLPYEEAAAALDCPLGTLKSRINRARAALKKLLWKDAELFVPHQRLNAERREDQ
ncbi:MAG: sigma-70 family RNA polymerase sigma factor [Christensenellales bacterium]